MEFLDGRTCALKMRQVMLHYQLSLKAWGLYNKFLLHIFAGECTAELTAISDGEAITRRMRRELAPLLELRNGELHPAFPEHVLFAAITMCVVSMYDLDRCRGAS
jgi:hypothetical protein